MVCLWVEIHDRVLSACLMIRQVFKATFKSSGKTVALKKLYLKEDDKGKEKNRDGV